MFNFYVDLAGPDLITDAGGAAKCGRKLNAPWFQNKVQKMKDLSKTWVLTGKQFEDFRRKKEKKQNSWRFKSTQWNTRPLNTTIEVGPGNQAETNWRKMKKAFRLKLFELCKTRTKK